MIGILKKVIINNNRKYIMFCKYAFFEMDEGIKNF